MTTIFTDRELKQLREYLGKMDWQGCLPVDQWTSGSGRFTTNRVLPPFVETYEKRDRLAPVLPPEGHCRDKALSFFRRNPRRRRVYVIDLDALYAFAGECMRGHEVPR